MRILTNLNKNEENDFNTLTVITRSSNVLRASYRNINYS